MEHKATTFIPSTPSFLSFTLFLSLIGVMSSLPNFITVHRIMSRDGEIVETSEPVFLPRDETLEALIAAIKNRPFEETKEKEKEMEVENNHTTSEKVVTDITMEAIENMREAAYERNKRARICMAELKDLFLEQCKETQHLKPGDQVFDRMLHMFDLYTPPSLPACFSCSVHETFRSSRTVRCEKGEDKKKCPYGKWTTKAL